jgi:hypothetical protein
MRSRVWALNGPYDTRVAACQNICGGSGRTVEPALQFALLRDQWPPTICCNRLPDVRADDSCLMGRVEQTGG